MRAILIIAFSLVTAGCSSTPTAKFDYGAREARKEQAAQMQPEIDIGKVEITVVSKEFVDDVRQRAGNPVCTYPQPPKKRWWQFWKTEPIQSATVQRP